MKGSNFRVLRRVVRRLPFLRRSPFLLRLALGEVSRTEVLTWIAIHRRCSCYLEIGVASGKNFLNVPVSSKIGVDPCAPGPYTERAIESGARYFQCTSDQFFSELAPQILAQTPPDLVFIDGLHTYSQALMDLKNAYRFAKTGAVIVLHDCNPPTPASAIPACSYSHAKQMNPAGWDGAWCGDVWKVIAQIRQVFPQLNCRVVDCDYGLGVIVKKCETSIDTLNVDESVLQLPYEYLAQSRKKILGLVSPLWVLRLGMKGKTHGNEVWS